MLETCNLSTSQPEVYFKTSLIDPEFQKHETLWVKSPVFEFSTAPNDAKFKFYKVGKTFGLLTKRTLVIRKHYMAYYESDNDKQVKGFCSLRNLYVGFFIVDQKYKYMVHFTNYTHSIQMYFEDRNELFRLKMYISKHVIQLKFNTKFDTLDPIGEGSFAKVFLAKRKNQSGQQYAIKMINKVDKNKNKTKDSVQQQRLALEVLHNQSFSKMYQFFEDNNCFYIVLEYIPGRSLMELLKQNFYFSLSVKQQILKGVLQGLFHCHSKKIIHRDLKPQNIIINLLTLRPKIIDLGLSLMLRQNSDIKCFKRCGTMGYIAPQVIANSSQSRKTYTCKVDIFSFGIIAHMLLFGVNPLKGKTYQQTTQKNKNMSFQLDKILIQKRYGAQCYDFLSRCLNKDPEGRLSAEQALAHKFLNQKIKEQQKTSEVSNVQHKSNSLYVFDEEEEDRVSKKIINH